MSNPLPLLFSGTVTGTTQTLSSTWPLDVSNGGSAGWSLSATSTTWTNGTHTLPTTATTITATPTVACDSPGNCTQATNTVTYGPYVLPAGPTAPTATKLFNAAAASGTGNQTITPAMKLTIPGSPYAGSYGTTLTLTLASGP